MATEPTTDPTAQPAMQQLLDFAAATRPDIDRRDLEGALIDAYETGCPWGWTLVATAQMLARGETPYELRDAIKARRLIRTGKPTP